MTLLYVKTLVVLLVNLDIKDGLVNGSIGNVRAFEDADPNMVPEYVGKPGSKAYAQYQGYMQQFPQLKWPWVRFNNGKTRLIKAHPRIKLFEATDEPSWACRTQLPLLKAWAMTIHKAQGMTLSQVEVDLEEVFEPGHLYVALSRAKTMDGLEVAALPKGHLGADPTVVQFNKDTFGIDMTGEQDCGTPQM